METGYGLPLCAPCRTKLARRPIPPFIIATALVVLLALVFAFASFPESLSAGIAYERGQRAEAAGNNAVAATDYRKVLQSYPNSIDAVIRYAVSSYHAGQYRQAGSALDKLSGQEVSKDQADEIDPIAQALERKTAAPPSP